jgi:hypothetical protein
LVADPATLPREQRLDALNECVGRLLAQPQAAMLWLGRSLQAALAGTVAIDEALGLRPPRGSRTTVAAIARRRARAQALVRLSVACGGDRAALAALRGAPAPLHARGMVQEFLSRFPAPRDPAAITKARRVVARHHR